MNLNATLLGQMITFALFVWFTMRYVWPPITKALHERQKKIAEGLAAAERGVHELELAQSKVKEQLREAKTQAAEMIEHANKRGIQIIEQAQLEAKQEGERMIALAKEQIIQQAQITKQALRKEISEMVIQVAQRVLAKNIDRTANHELIAKLIEEV
jgi:F-type H+-transporting ATPase subunit b